MTAKSRRQHVALGRILSAGCRLDVADAGKVALELRELLLEVPEGEAEEARTLVKETMEGALRLNVPLVADAHLGRNWAEVH